MSSMLRLSLVSILALALLTVASAASAADSPDPDGEPPPSASKANLVFSSASVALSGTQYEIRYTVKNSGTVGASPFHVSVQYNGGALIKDAANVSLAVGATRADVIRVNATSCYIAVRLTADSTRVVNESREYDNERTVVALTNPSCSAQPKYKVKAVSFHAVDESWIDIGGSDEVYWILSAAGPNGTSTSASHVFGDVDAGETRSFGATEGCLYLTCSTGGAAPFGLGLSVQLWEQDDGDLAKVLAETAPWIEKAGAVIGPIDPTTWLSTTLSLMAEATNVISALAEDDLLGSQTFAYSPVFLAGKLPTIGSSFTDARRYSGGFTSGGAVYDMTLAVTRVA
jgi:hypothetical protein